MWELTNHYPPIHSGRRLYWAWGHRKIFLVFKQQWFLNQNGVEFNQTRPYQSDLMVTLHTSPHFNIN